MWLGRIKRFKIMNEDVRFKIGALTAGLSPSGIVSPALAT